MSASTVTPAPFVDRDRYSNDAREVLAALDARVSAVIADIDVMPGWQALMSADTPPAQARVIIREVFRSVSWYQRHTTEAGFLMLGRLPKNESALMKALLLHKHEEAEHGLWALRDYLALGGTRDQADMPPSPATFAVASVWWRLATVEEPLGYLGAEYLFECLTMRIAGRVLDALRQHTVSEDQIGFIVEHATEDIKHTNLITHLILDIASRYPEAGQAMLRCFDYFRQVYPEPVWAEAYERAVS